MSDTGKRIRIRRKELGISADKLAEILGCSRTTIFRYENGDIEKVPGDIIPTLAKALYTTPAYLMGWEDNLNEDTDFIAEIFTERSYVEHVRKLLSLSNSNKEIVFNMIDFLSSQEKGL